LFVLFLFIACLGFLTALTAAQYFDEETGEEISNPDPRGGLYVVDRDSIETKLDIPASDLVVQCGECLQVHTGGLVSGGFFFISCLLTMLVAGGDAACGAALGGKGGSGREDAACGPRYVSCLC
jgi:hypothetical protein